MAHEIVTDIEQSAAVWQWDASSLSTMEYKSCHHWVVDGRHNGQSTVLVSTPTLFLEQDVNLIVNRTDGDIQSQ